MNSFAFPNRIVTQVNSFLAIFHRSDSHGRSKINFLEGAETSLIPKDG